MRKGNVHDAVEFSTVTEELCTCYRQLSEACDHITLVFDKGNNCEQAFDTLEQSPFHFVGSLVPTQHPDLLAVPRSKFRPAAEARLESVQLYRTEKKVFGRTYTVVVTFNQNLLDGQLQGLSLSLNKARRKLRALQHQLRRWRETKLAGNRPRAKGTKR